MTRFPPFVLTIAILTIAFAGCGHPNEESSKADSIQVIGITTDTMNFNAAEQRTENWCWAACVQMALSTRGIDISQREIAAKAFGGGELNRGGSPLDILKNLDGLMTDRIGRDWRLEALPGLGPPSLELMREQFERDMPLIVSYEVPGQLVGHAVVITAVIYETTDIGPQIRRVLIRDPWPAFHESLGKREMAPEEFDRIFVHYLVIPSKA